jgi:hypothetical protein
MNTEPLRDSPAAPHDGTPAVRPDAAYFAQPVCRNCGEAAPGRHCAACGQARAQRLGVGAVGNETWSSWRLFEWELVRAAARLIAHPGSVAREYVLGARKRHIHPLKLLLVAIGLLLLVLARGNYLDSADAQLNRTMALVREWSKWSFSLGIFATLAASLLVFRRRGGYNPVEHLVLAAYCQVVVIAASIANKLPVLFWRDPAFIAAHKAWSAWYMDAAGALVVGVAFVQFFALDPRRDAPRLVGAIALFLAVKWTLLRLYALLLVHVALAQAAA